MIARLRASHRIVAWGLALIVPMILFAALAVRPQPPVMSETPAALTHRTDVPPPRRGGAP